MTEVEVFLQQLLLNHQPPVAFCLGYVYTKPFEFGSSIKAIEHTLEFMGCSSTELKLIHTVPHLNTIAPCLNPVVPVKRNEFKTFWSGSRMADSIQKLCNNTDFGQNSAVFKIKAD